MGADHDQAIRWAEVLRQTERLLSQSALANDAITAWATLLTPEQRAAARGLIEQYEALHHQALDVLTAVLLHWPAADPPATPSWTYDPRRCPPWSRRW